MKCYPRENFNIYGEALLSGHLEILFNKLFHEILFFSQQLGNIQSYVHSLIYNTSYGLNPLLIGRLNHTQDAPL